MPPKRRQSLTETSARSLKRRAQPKQAIAVDSDDEDLQAILAVIKQQEESEALARQLQAEWAANDQAPQAGPSRQDELIIIEDDILAENDEALARRLQAEWSTEDAVAGPPASGSDPASQHQSRASSATRGLDDPTSSLPNARLRAYKGHFIGTRQCSKCQADVPSPRGYVRAPPSVPLCTMTQTNIIGRLYFSSATSLEPNKTVARSLRILPDCLLSRLLQGT